jgi:hypothetical protein
MEEPDDIRERLQIASVKVLLGFGRVIDHFLGISPQFGESCNQIVRHDVKRNGAARRGIGLSGRRRPSLRTARPRQ